MTADEGEQAFHQYASNYRSVANDTYKRDGTATRL